MQILVCGTNYGATYLRALTHFSQQSEKLTLAALLSQGSSRSLNYAQQFQIPHYTAVKQIPPGSIDVACIATQGHIAVELAVALLQQGIHVICEHPLATEQMQQLLTVAKQHQCIFMVNAHFADLAAPQHFLQGLQVAQQHSRALHYQLTANLRTLYSALDLLGRAVGDLSAIQPRPIANTADYFTNITLEHAQFTVSFLCQNFSSAEDDGSATLFNHRFSAAFSHGNLLLAETNGPVLWFPTPVSLSAEHWQTCLPVTLETLNFSDLQQQRDRANLTVIQQLQAYQQGRDSLPFWQQPSYLLALATLWQSVLAQLQPVAIPE